ncbi:FtsQ-type POTRA domain-containing protein [Microbacterium sp. YJN-G]|uniref:FtsQ-type POTRA domain-containing protein n=1 Tax=Microbacterium sp. YJN-G TaxID=2763257 RepID=UPI001877B79D|nr:FtsQ-type POTRA domain-containing protein [Microbacterium sp. YJN-G]
MRRPAPLPASAQKPESVEPAAPRPRSIRSRFARDTDRADAADATWEAPSDAERAESAGADAHADTAVLDDAVRDIAEGAQDAGDHRDAVRTGDVWRAARARRKALRAEIRRFTQRSRRRRLVWWGSFGAVVALILGSVVAAYSPLFAIREITVAGVRSLDPAVVQTALEGQLGAPLALVDAGAVRSALSEFPMIESYALEARPPHELLVRIVERTPIGVIRSDDGFTLVDAAGVALATTPQRPDGQPELSISGGTDSAAFRSAGLVVRSLPAELRAQVTEVNASSADDVTLALQDGKTIVWGSERDSSEKALVLVALIKNAPDARNFDVSAPSVPVVR